MPAQTLEIELAAAVTNVLKNFFGDSAVRDVAIDHTPETCNIQVNIEQRLGLKNISLSVKALSARESFASMTATVAIEPALPEHEGYSDEPLVVAPGAGARLVSVGDEQL